MGSVYNINDNNLRDMNVMGTIKQFRGKMFVQIMAWIMKYKRANRKQQ